MLVVATKHTCAATRSDTHRLAEGLWRLFVFALMDHGGWVAQK